jgi:uncharacterized membrane protein YgcG
MRKLLACVAIIVSVRSAAAQERIISYNSQVEIVADGSVDVTERIKVHADGNQIRRGIYRDFPTRYTDRFGNRLNVDLDVLSVQRNDVMEPWFTEKMSNGIRINTGNDTFLTVPADYTYTIRYRVTRELGFFPDHDELYWNAIGTGWIFPIESASVDVHLPIPVPTENLHAEGYTGSQGSKGVDYVADLPAPGSAHYRTTRPLAPNEGFTVVLTFPKGIIHEPTQRERAGWLLEDNRGVLAALAGLMLILLYMVRTWKRVGRDPQKGIIIARYEPRDGQTPAGLRFMERMGYDMRCFTGDILALAVSGRVKIHQEKKLLSDQWSLERIEPNTPTPISLAQQTLLDILFRDKPTLVLKNTNATTVSEACSGHKEILNREYQPEYFNRNGKKVAVAVLIGAVAALIAVGVSGGSGIPLILAVLIVMLIAIVIFARLVRAPTLAGRALRDEIEGLMLYLSVAEKNELASMRGPDEPPLDAKRYEALLPFAVALGVEEAWTGKFTAAVGAAAAAQAANNMTWYAGRGPISSLGDFSSAIGSSLSSTISSASTPPGSSSGSGGGGFSGGGGGGGGGGGR